MAEFYRVSRTSMVPASALVVFIDGETPGTPGFGIRAESAKDPADADPSSPLWLSDEERAGAPDGIVWSQVLSARQVAALQADPALAAHFTFDPLS